MKRYCLGYKMFNTENEAREFCNTENSNATYYIRKNKPSHYTPWNSQDGREHKFIAWYYYSIY